MNVANYIWIVIWHWVHNAVIDFTEKRPEPLSVRSVAVVLLSHDAQSAADIENLVLIREDHSELVV